MSKKDVAAQEGDLVQFIFALSDPHHSNRLTGYLHHSPCATGDAWIIETDQKEITYIQQYETMTILKRKGGVARGQCLSMYTEYN